MAAETRTCNIYGRADEASPTRVLQGRRGLAVPHAAAHARIAELQERNKELEEALESYADAIDTCAETLGNTQDERDTYKAEAEALRETAERERCSVAYWKKAEENTKVEWLRVCDERDRALSDLAAAESRVQELEQLIKKQKETP